MKIAILDDYADTIRTLDAFGALAGHDVTIWRDHVQDPDVLSARLQDTEALVLIRERTAIGADLLGRLPVLRLISQRGTYPHVDVAACTRHGVVLSSSTRAGGPSWATAELTWGLVLAAARDLPGQIASLKEGRWQTQVGTTLRGKTLGIWSFGKIGAAVAGFGRAFGMKVVVHGRPDALARARGDGFEVEANRTAFFEICDVISLHLRLNAETRGIVTAADLACMKPTAILVNTSRAPLIEPGALVAALRAGRPGFAAVDVFDEEPLRDRDDPLLALPNAICTPHLGYVTREDFEGQFSEIFGQINAFARGTPINVVNPEALTGRPT